jgi:hypothetical protein
MAAIKSATVTMRMPADLRDAIKVAAHANQRSIPSQCEHVLRKWLEEEKFLPLPVATKAATKAKPPAKRR